MPPGPATLGAAAESPCRAYGAWQIFSARTLAGPGGKRAASSKHTSWTSLLWAVTPPPALSQLVVSLVFARADRVGSAWTVCLHLSTSCAAVSGRAAPVLVAVGLVLADGDLLLPPQPARNAPPATVTSSHMDSFRIKCSLSSNDGRSPSSSVARQPSYRLLLLAGPHAALARQGCVRKGPAARRTSPGGFGRPA